jgi:hypothetical protein
VQTSLDKADAAPTQLGQLSDVSASGPADTQVLAYSTTASKWVASTVTSTTVDDATTSSKGIVQLAGDLAGTAAAPTVPSLANKADTSALTAHINDTTSVHGIADTSALLTGNGISTVVNVTQAEYDALSPPDANTLYVVVG